MTAVRLHAPAKLNLYLRILGRRPDGYHELETLFQRIDLADELTFEPDTRLTLTCNRPELSRGPDNLVLRAAAALQQVTGTSRGARIHLEKRVPIAAGLGGGSSDSATALVGLNRLWELGLSLRQLRDVAATLGSDVPFFLEPESVMIGRGRGERCEPVAGPLPVLWQVLVAPAAGLSTKEVYEGFARPRPAPERESLGLTESPPSLTMCLHALRNGSLGELAQGLWNDLQPEAIRRCPVIQDIHTVLRRAGSLGVLTSGSGPAAFGLCTDAAHAGRVAEQVRAEGRPDWFVHVVRTWNREHASLVT